MFIIFDTVRMLKLCEGLMRSVKEAVVIIEEIVEDLSAETWPVCQSSRSDMASSLERNSHRTVGRLPFKDHTSDSGEDESNQNIITYY